MNNNRVGYVIILILFPLITAVICLSFGRFSLGVTEIIDIIFGKNSDDTAYIVLFNLRIPRIVSAMMVGAGLSVAGASFQGLFKNPLATPDTMGVAGGACFGAVLALLFGFNLMAVQIISFVFGLTACFITYRMSSVNGQSGTVMLLLSGITVSSIFSALTSLVKYVADPLDKLPSITYWLLGSMAGLRVKGLLFAVPFVLVGIIIIFFLRFKLNILTLDDEEAASLGENVRLLKLLVIIAATMITASAVAVCGQVGWVGLLMPHLSRMIVGSDNRKVVSLSICLGSSFMLIVDTVARSLAASEIPLSILTALFGAPFFIILLRKTKGINL